eukprot:753649-Hanusia_phi.AAC.1
MDYEIGVITGQRGGRGDQGSTQELTIIVKVDLVLLWGGGGPTWFYPLSGWQAILKCPGGDLVAAATRGRCNHGYLEQRETGVTILRGISEAGVGFKFGHKRKE